MFPIINPATLYFYPISSLKEVEFYRGKLVEYKTSSDSLNGSNVKYAFVEPLKHDVNGQEICNFALLLNDNDVGEQNQQLTNEKLKTAELQLRLLNPFEVKEVHDLLAAKKVKFDLPDEEQIYITFYINYLLRCLNNYLHFDSYSNTFQSPKIGNDYIKRPALYKKIENRLNHNPTTAADYPLLILVGMAGIGKTVLAKQYFHSRSSEQQYQFRAWFDAKDETNLYVQYIKLANDHDISYPVDATNDKQIIAIKKWLEQQTDSLFVYDNLNDEKLLEKFIPTTKNHVLITSKNSHVYSQSCMLEIDELDQDSARELIINHHPAAQHDKDLDDLIRTLGYLPLALTQAATYMEKKWFSCSKILKLLSNPQLHQQLLAYDDFYYEEHDSVWETFNQELEQLKSNNPNAYVVLQKLSQSYSGWISRDILSEFTNNRLEADDLMEDLTKSFLVQCSQDFKQIKINPILKYMLCETSANPTIEINANRLFAKINSPGTQKNTENDSKEQRRMTTCNNI